MAIIVFKVITLFVKGLAKPLISWVTHYKKLKLKESNPNVDFIKNRILWIGQFINYYNIKINRKLFRLDNSSPIKALSEEKAIEKGAEFVSEVFIYAIVITLPVLEWLRISQISRKERYLKEQEIRRIKNDINALSDQNLQLQAKLDELKYLIAQIRGI